MGIYQRVGLTQRPIIQLAQRYKTHKKNLHTQRQNTKQTKQMLYGTKSSIKITVVKAPIILILIIIFIIILILIIIINGDWCN